MLGILCGFESEAKVARLFTHHVACSGALEDVARLRAEELVSRGATILLSFGLAGGLAPSLKPGVLVLGTHVTDKTGRKWPCDEKLLMLMEKALDGVTKGGVFGSDVLMPGPEQKKPLYKTTGCAIVDMESQIVAEAAARHGIPFGVLRGVSDTVEEIFPEAAHAGIRPDGSINLPATLLSLAKNPLQLPSLLRLFANTAQVLKNLEKAAPSVTALMGRI